MSDDLRYYFFDQEADGQPSISAEEGWQQMQQLLNADMPLLSKRKPRRYIFFITGVLTTIIFLTTALPLKNYLVHGNETSVFKHNIISKAKKHVVATQDENTNNKIKATTAQHRYVNHPIGNQMTSAGFNDAVIDSYNSNTPNDILVNIYGDKTKSNEVTLNNPLINKDTISSITTKTDNKEEKTTAQSSEQKKSAKTVYKKWYLNGGLAENISLSNTTHALQPYPFAELQYQFVPRFFVSASLALFAPVGSNANGIKRTVYLNDTSADVSRYNEKLNYQKLSYADLSLTAGIKLTSKISVQSGVQFSRLLSTKTKTSLDPYDFDSNRIRVTDVGTLAPIPSAAPVYNNMIDPHKLDIRYIAGISYNAKKISFSMQYQAGVRPVLKGAAVSSDKNKLITLRAAYRFK
ncbi:hypothetical protein FRZ67_01370 [Panacibacter ginsenosidivorans]|uniref:Uncharacterized protein n=1 Tax=Panacibacter ginsenosidivorans TaxID=1813871 RepID=A0A5B8V4B4_9BACT|nr:hypothetical protein [Panacibacter ginsenosidivorans]QEC66018.1 hypothetical protein FRZ67_01370 [Panacibacter ginsenosidivorans]